MIRFLDLTQCRFDGGAPPLDDGAAADELRARVHVLVSRGILIALWLAAGIAFFALIFIAMFL